MSPHKQVTLLRFQGPRFEDHGLDVDVLPELMAYKRLLQETAKEIWRREHPERMRLPKMFEADITLKFFRLEPGSTAVPLMRVRDLSSDHFPMATFFDDEVDQAATLLENTIRAAGVGQDAPSKLPRRVIPLFDELGRTLREDEFLLVSAGTREEAARFDAGIRERILSWASSSYTDLVELTGEVRATDLDGLRFTLRLDDGRKIEGRFKPEHETVVLEALGEHFSRRMHVKGVGEFAPEDGTLKQIVEVQRIDLTGPDMTSDTGSPIWQRLASIGAAVPADAWNDVPNDLAANVDQYLYGRKDRH
jgi:hypothetical protein